MVCNGTDKKREEAETAHVSALLCHLGNISHRVDRMVKCDPENGGRILDDEKAMGYWKRDDESGWEPVL